MKITLLFILVIAECILVAGCVGQIKNTSVNISTVNTTNTFIPFSNATNISSISNSSNITITPGLNGSLRVYIGGLDAVLPVSVDNKTIGNVTKVKPLDLMLQEGNHTVKVCCGIMCEQENVTISFGKLRTVDFSEQMKKDCEFFEPTARIVGYSTNADKVDINVEFINPTTQMVTISAEIRVGYSYIDDRSDTRVGDFVNGQVSSTLYPGDRIKKILNLGLISHGSSYLLNIPIITQVSTN